MNMFELPSLWRGLFIRDNSTWDLMPVGRDPAGDRSSLVFSRHGRASSSPDSFVSFNKMEFYRRFLVRGLTIKFILDWLWPAGVNECKAPQVLRLITLAPILLTVNLFHRQPESRAGLVKSS